MAVQPVMGYQYGRVAGMEVENGKLHSGVDSACRTRQKEAKSRVGTQTEIDGESRLILRLRMVAVSAMLGSIVDDMFVAASMRRGQDEDGATSVHLIGNCSFLCSTAKLNGGFKAVTTIAVRACELLLRSSDDIVLKTNHTYISVSADSLQQFRFQRC